LASPPLQTGTENLSGIKFKFQFQTAQKRLLQQVSRNGGTYIQLKAPQTLEIGGIRSGKTSGKLMFGIENYTLKFRHCDILILRRTFSELDSGVIQDFKTHVPSELYSFNQTTRIATFNNGSRVVFAGCVREGTLIDTDRGLIPIEQVAVTDRVLTRNGYRKVLWSGKTGMKPVISLGSLYITAEHPIYCNGEFIPAQEIVCRKVSGKTVQLVIRKSSFSEAGHTAVGRMPRIITREDISLGRGATEGLYPFMPLFGKVLTVKYRKDLKYITPTTTALTTSQKISSSWSGENTGNCTLSRVVTSPRNARYARKSLNTGAESRYDSAVGDAATKVGLLLNNPPLSEDVDFATVQFSELDARMLHTATISAVNDGTPVPVYDLTVEGDHEYFANGILVHNCVNNKERDIEKYLGQSYPFILVDECGQFSPDAWELLYSRNTVNAACEPDEHGNFPIPSITGCTNPIGPFWEYYHTLFVQQQPWIREDGLRRAKDGSWWAPEAGSWRLVYDPKNYAHNHTTVLDNEIYIKQRDPGIIARLKALPPAKMKKMLLGLMDRVEGQFFDCFSEEGNVVDLREDPEAIIWQDWQPVWGGQDWGMGHWNAFYLFTKALVRNSVGTDYKLKTVCFKELAPETTGHTNVHFADMIQAVACYPKLPESHPQYERISGKRCKVQAIFFSHEKFSRVMEAHSPADDYSRLLRVRGLPPVSRATQDRIGSAGFMYNELKTGQLVILATCQGIIMAIPSLQRDPDNLDDVLKVDSKADDRYDGFRLGLYGMLGSRKTPDIEKAKAFADSITDPYAKFFYLRKNAINKSKEGEPFKPKEIPYWQTKM
jgi:hypothetical protein